ncbi:MAG: DoxX family protein [Candidatus Binatia bacterium]
MNNILQIGENWGLLLIRIGLGVVFLVHGYPKMTGLWHDVKGSRQSLTKSIERLGLPFPFHLAILVGTIEFVGGGMLVLGLWARVAALGLVVIMLVATGRNFIQKGFIGSADFPFSILTTLLGLIFLGSGSISLDGLLF